MAGLMGPAAESPQSGDLGLSELLRHFTADAPPTDGAGAAVTIVLRDGTRDLEVLLIERTTRQEDPASGQIALPGGRVERRDRDLRATALRELEEEVGLGERDLVPPVRYIATEPSNRFGMSVGIFGAELGPQTSGPTRLSPHEVAHVFWLPRDALQATVVVPRETPVGTISVDATVFEGHVLWGFTLRVLRRFFLRPPPTSAPPSGVVPYAEAVRARSGAGSQGASSQDA
ncbi:MAG: NUDIX domain-containing protein [Thermoplasmata archaeon]|nr:NUDIX domain-containing protein [Thermoplasmata archaeon]